MDEPVKPAIELSVNSDFGEYKRGDIIRDPEKVAAILAGEHEHNVVKRKAATPKV